MKSISNILSALAFVCAIAFGICSLSQSQKHEERFRVNAVEIANLYDNLNKANASVDSAFAEISLVKKRIKKIEDD